ncbi:MAG: hypothetical protein CMB92_04810 [Flammeovirgaceae bacterium]|nr:hypothetical protein [Flammeovirgaceae bacterium]
MSFMNNLMPNFIKENINYYKKNGLKKTIKKLGWKVVLLVFLFYLIRDSILYIIIPYFVAREFNIF